MNPMDATPPTLSAVLPPPMPARWCVLELLGHRRLVGRVTEVDLFGRRMGKIEVPYILPTCTACYGTGRVKNPDGWCRHCNGFAEHYFQASSVYAMSVVGEDAVRAEIARAASQVARWALPPSTRFVSAEELEDELQADTVAPDRPLCRETNCPGLAEPDCYAGRCASHCGVLCGSECERALNDFEPVLNDAAGDRNDDTAGV
jgi:hypothetical protein